MMEIPEGFELGGTALEAVRALDRGDPVVFLTGRAGTGKTTFIRYIQSRRSCNLAIVASTGLAALNVGGQTIHSFFRFPARAFNRKEIRQRRSAVIDHLDLLVIDEVSMVRADLMDHIDYALRLRRRNREPFGGVQLLLVGDCLQLPPVVDSSAEHEMFTSVYDGPWFFDAHVFQTVKITTVELVEIYRQKDPVFVSLLNRIRVNSDHREAVAQLNRRCYRDVTDKDAALTLTATNAQADRINLEHLRALPGEERCYLGEVAGDFRLDGRRVAAPQRLCLKPGAQVMVVRNITGAVNGTLGEVVDTGDGVVIIHRLDNGEPVTCRVESWEQNEFRWDRDAEEIVSEVVGRFKQLPLALGWAVTIHKSQGQTLDSVRIDLGRGAFAAGQTYVALSRCRSIDHLRLARPISMRDVIADPRIIEFYNRLEKPEETAV